MAALLRFCVVFVLGIGAAAGAYFTGMVDYLEQGGPLRALTTPTQDVVLRVASDPGGPVSCPMRYNIENKSGRRLRVVFAAAGESGDGNFGTSPDANTSDPRSGDNGAYGPQFGANGESPGAPYNPSPRNNPYSGPGAPGFNGGGDNLATPNFGGPAYDRGYPDNRAYPGNQAYPSNRAYPENRSDNRGYEGGAGYGRTQGQMPGYGPPQLYYNAYLHPSGGTERNASPIHGVQYYGGPQYYGGQYGPQQAQQFRPRRRRGNGIVIEAGQRRLLSAADEDNTTGDPPTFGGGQYPYASGFDPRCGYTPPVRLQLTDCATSAGGVCGQEAAQGEVVTQGTDSGETQGADTGETASGAVDNQ